MLTYTNTNKYIMQIAFRLGNKPHNSIGMMSGTFKPELVSSNLNKLLLFLIISSLI